MSTGLQTVINEFVMMWVLIDPIGTLPVFLMATGRMKPEHRTLIAVRAVLVAGGVLTFFIFGGRLLLTALGIPLDSFQIAGGIVLFLFALTMIFGPSKVEQEKEEAATLERAKSIAVFPLAIPTIASPGAMLGAVLLNDTDFFSLPDTAYDLGITWLLLAITLGFMMAARPILNTIGESGANVVSRIMGLILAAVAVDSVLVAVVDYFKISGVTPTGLL